MPALEALRTAVTSHTGVFLCTEIHASHNAKTLKFRHAADAAAPDVEVPDVPGLRDFYDTFARLTLYLEEDSGDAAFSIASPDQWAELKSDFEVWIDDLSDDEADECLPDWLPHYVVVGEVPHSGNYLLVPTTGPEVGCVYLFDHDGFEFAKLGSTLAEFVASSLDLDTKRLTDMASHMRFITQTENRQWWIDALKDNRGNNVSTEA
jgi:hypothetical protein